MLELLIAGSMLAVVMSSLSLVLRTARQSWEVSDHDYGAMHQAHAVARHFVRAAREAQGVASIASDGSALEIRTLDGATQRWAWATANGNMHGVVLFSQSGVSGSRVLAHDVESLSFSIFEADAFTVASSAEDARLIRVQVTVNSPSGNVSSQTVDSYVWIRSW